MNEKQIIKKILSTETSKKIVLTILLTLLSLFLIWLNFFFASLLFGNVI